MTREQELELRKDVIEVANEIAAEIFPYDYDPDEPIDDIPGALTTLMAERLQDYDTSLIYDFVKKHFNDKL